MPKPKGLYNAGAPAQESDQSQAQEVRSAQLSRIHLRKGDSQKGQFGEFPFNFALINYCKV